LIEKYPPRDYRSIVLEFGFPGPGFHGLPYARLKDRCIQKLVSEKRQGKPGRVLFLTGCRRQESSRRMGNAKVIDDSRKKDGMIWAAPIVNWSGRDKHDYMDRHNLTRNPVYDFLCMSGECLCGAFAAPGEFAQLEMFYPHVARQIRELEAEAQEAGVHAQWGARPPRKPDPNQADLEDYAGPMCWSCAAKQEKAGVHD
jgi:3'-phosphoadenosine 5'-phosphosulfate sulfotransferase (PAPS reductase)/FAD synthetase